MIELPLFLSKLSYISLFSYFIFSREQVMAYPRSLTQVETVAVVFVRLAAVSSRSSKPYLLVATYGPVHFNADFRSLCPDNPSSGVPELEDRSGIVVNVRMIGYQDIAVVLIDDLCVEG